MLDHRPARVLRIHEPGVGLDAFVVIDRLRFPFSAGGTRMAPGVTEQEVASLARAMTWKFAVYELPIAGAKGGIDFGGRGDREALLSAYKQAVEPWRELFGTGPDMGTSADDFLPDGAEDRPMWARTHDGRGMDDLATGRGSRPLRRSRSSVSAGRSKVLRSRSRDSGRQALGARSRSRRRVPGWSRSARSRAHSSLPRAWTSTSCSPCGTTTGTGSSTSGLDAPSPGKQCSPSPATCLFPERAHT